jgi:hypothetical protein
LPDRQKDTRMRCGKARRCVGSSVTAFPSAWQMQITGHKTRSVFERYNIVSTGDLQTARTQLSGLLTRATQKQQETGS